MKAPKLARLAITDRRSTYINRHEITEKTLNQAFDLFLEDNPLYQRENLSLEVEYSHGYYDEIDIDFYINAHRMETDEEYNARCEKAAIKKLRDAENAKKSKLEAAKRQEAKDLAEYKRLRKIFRDKIKDMEID